MVSELKLGDSKGWTIFNTDGLTLTNFSASEVFYESDIIPRNHIVTLKDLNTMFTTTGGAIDYGIVTKSGTFIPFALNRSSNDNGTFNAIATAGDRFAVRINSSGTGSGVISLVWHGEIKRVAEDVPEENVFSPSGEPGEQI